MSALYWNVIFLRKSRRFMKILTLYANVGALLKCRHSMKNETWKTTQVDHLTVLPGKLHSDCSSLLFLLALAQSRRCSLLHMLLLSVSVATQWLAYMGGLLPYRPALGVPAKCWRSTQILASIWNHRFSDNPYLLNQDSYQKTVKAKNDQGLALCSYSHSQPRIWGCFEIHWRLGRSGDTRHLHGMVGAPLLPMILPHGSSQWETCVDGEGEEERADENWHPQDKTGSPTSPRSSYMLVCTHRLPQGVGSNRMHTLITFRSRGLRGNPKSPLEDWDRGRDHPPPTPNTNMPSSWRPNSAGEGYGEEFPTPFANKPSAWWSYAVRAVQSQGVRDFGGGGGRCTSSHFLKGSLTWDFLLRFFFHKSVSPGPLSIGSFWIFLKIRGDISEINVYQRFQQHRRKKRNILS